MPVRARKTGHGALLPLTAQVGAAAGRNMASPASLATDLELTRAELRRTRDERDRLKAKVQRGLGHQVTQAGTTELATRIKDLTSRIGQQDAELAWART